MFHSFWGQNCMDTNCNKPTPEEEAEQSLLMEDADPRSGPG